MGRAVQTARKRTGQSKSGARVSGEETGLLVLPELEKRSPRPTFGADSVSRQIAPQGWETYLGAAGFKAIPRAMGRELQELQAIRVVRDLDADASMAVWNMVKLGNPGFTTAVRDLAGNPVPDAKKRCDELAKRMWRDGGGGADGLVDVFNLAGFSYGGIGAEVVPTPDFKDVDDVYPFGPADIEFMQVRDPNTGQVKTAMFPARRKPGEQVMECSPAQVHYLPIDPDIDDPYGRPPMLPAMASVVQLQGLLNELQYVARVHGYGMRDIVIDEQAVLATAPEWMKDGSHQADLDSYMSSEKQAIKDAVEKLKPWETLIHFSFVRVNTTTPGGQGPANDAVIAQLSRKLVTSLKSMPFMLGNTETIQTMSTTQWQIYVKGLKSILKKIKRMLEWIFNTALRLWGYAAMCTVEFNDIRETDRAIDAGADAAEMANEIQKYQQGAISFEELCQKLARHGAPDPQRRPPTLAEQFFATYGYWPGEENLGQGTGTGLGLGTGTTLPATTPPAQDPNAALPTTSPPGSGQGITAGEIAALNGNLPSSNAAEVVREERGVEEVALAAMLEMWAAPEGSTEERRVLGHPQEGNDHCKQCVEYSERGWVPVGTLPVPTQDCDCGSNCLCTMEYR